MVGPLPVREYATAEEMRAHAAALRIKAFAKPALKPTKSTASAQNDAVSLYSELMLIPPPNKHVTRAAYLAAMAELRAEEHSLKSIIRIVAVVTGVTIAEIQSDQRNNHICKARFIAAYIAGRAGGRSLNQVGGVLGDRDHTTIMHAQNRVRDVMAALRIEWSDDLVSLAQKLWDASWPARKAA